MLSKTKSSPSRRNVPSSEIVEFYRLTLDCLHRKTGNSLAFVCMIITYYNQPKAKIDVF